jgi:hypothetical protein
MQGIESYFGFFLLMFAIFKKERVFLANVRYFRINHVLLGPRAVFNILSHELTYTGTWLDIYLAQGLKGVI